MPFQELGEWARQSGLSDKIFIRLGKKVVSINSVHTNEERLWSIAAADKNLDDLQCEDVVFDVGGFKYPSREELEEELNVIPNASLFSAQHVNKIR